MANIFLLSEDTNVGFNKDRLILYNDRKIEEASLDSIKNFFLLRFRNIPLKIIKKLNSCGINFYRILPNGDITDSKPFKTTKSNPYDDSYLFCFLLYFINVYKKFFINLFKRDKVLVLNKKSILELFNYEGLPYRDTLDRNKILFTYNHINSFIKMFANRKLNGNISSEYKTAIKFSNSLVKSYIYSFLIEKDINPEKMFLSKLKFIDLFFEAFRVRVEIFITDIFPKYLILNDFDDKTNLKYFGRLILSKLIAGKFIYGERFNSQLEETLKILNLIQEEKLDCLGNFIRQ